MRRRTNGRQKHYSTRAVRSRPSSRVRRQSDDEEGVVLLGDKKK